MSKAAGRRPAVDDSDDDDVPARSAAASSQPYRTDPKGDELRREAEKKLKGGFSSLFSSASSRAESAIELYEKAAAQYKMNKNWQEAGECYRACADLFRTQLKEAHDEGTMLENAAKAFKNCDTKEALKCYQGAVEILMENNKFSMGAKIWKEMAMMQEKEHDLKGAMNSYQKAADCYEADSSTINASTMSIKVAGIAADAGDYKKAISIYEKVSRASLESSAARWSVKGYLFRALLCHFALHAPSHHLDTVSSKLEQYTDLCPDMDGSREKQLIEDLVQDFADQDPDKFAEHVFTFDEICKLDNWTAKVLLEIKKALEAGNPDDGGVAV